MTKRGRWHAFIDLTLEGEAVPWEDLSGSTQEHILKLIAEGFRSGEIFEETDDVEEDEND